MLNHTEFSIFCVPAMNLTRHAIYLFFNCLLFKVSRALVFLLHILVACHVKVTFENFFINFSIFLVQFTFVVIF